MEVFLHLCSDRLNVFFCLIGLNYSMNSTLSFVSQSLIIIDKLPAVVTKSKYMKNIILILLMLPMFSAAQQLIVEGTSGKIYLKHIAAPKENFYSIGRLYNISPKEIAPYNKLSLENGLSIGQAIRVPLEAVNFTQTNNVPADEAAVPVYHTVGAKETLFQLSTKYNKVAVASLKKWNNLKDENVLPEQNIIIGYLKVKKDLSALAQQGTKIPKEQSEVAQIPLNEKIAKKQDEVAKIKEDIKVKIEEKIDTEKKVEVEKPVVKAVPTPKVNIGNREGIFRSMYANAGKEESGIAGVFKSTSGWEDGKYYCLHNTAEQNSVVKITNLANGKFVYAKVLDAMPDLKKNSNLSIQISNAAADALGADLANFNCKIDY